DQGIAQFNYMLRTMLHRCGCQSPVKLPVGKLDDVTQWRDPGLMPSSVDSIAQKCGLAIKWDKLERFSRYVLWHFAKRGDKLNFKLAFQQLDR
ncbi:MAG: hypothetical protein OEU36_17800, partial [Gammaproteobacteria bacterium]|nr:hypothetical protein [Gammaproteobacteria bacterium]